MLGLRNHNRFISLQIENRSAPLWGSAERFLFVYRYVCVVDGYYFDCQVEETKSNDSFTIFIDESFDAPTSKRSLNYFYILSAALIPDEALFDFEQLVQGLMEGQAFHASDIARRLDGELLISQVVAGIRMSNTHIVYCHDPIEISDKLGEAARSQSLKRIMTWIGLNYSQEQVDVVLDRRRPGYEQESDKRRITELRREGIIDRASNVGFANTSEAAGLAAADLSAWVIRQHVTGRSSTYFKKLSASSLTQVK